MPNGHIVVSYMGNRYFFHEGSFFSRHRDGFVVINAPVGAKVPSLPSGSSRVSVNGETLFSANHTLFRRVPDGFIVVGSR
jgi:hypothetical protein